jgi:hypothetical protein
MSYLQNANNAWHTSWTTIEGIMDNKLTGECDALYCHVMEVAIDGVCIGNCI